MFSRRKSLIGNSAEFENDVRLNREPLKRISGYRNLMD